MKEVIKKAIEGGYYWVGQNYNNSCFWKWLFWSFKWRHR